MKYFVVLTTLLQVVLSGFVGVRLPYLNPAGVTYVDGNSYEKSSYGLAAGHNLEYPSNSPVLSAGPGAYPSGQVLQYSAGPSQIAAKVQTHHVGYATAQVPAVAAVPVVKHVPTVSEVPVTRYEEHHAVVDKHVDVVKPAVSTRKFQVRRPAIQKQFYDIEEHVIVRPAGSALVELDEPISKVQKGPAVIQSLPEASHVAVSPSPNTYAQVAHEAEFAHVTHDAHVAHNAHIAKVAHDAEAAKIAYNAQVAHDAHNAEIAHNAQIAYNAQAAHDAHNAEIAHNAQVAYNAQVAQDAHNAEIAHNAQIAYNAQVAHDAHNAEIARNAQLAHDAHVSHVTTASYGSLAPVHVTAAPLIAHKSVHITPVPVHITPGAVHVTPGPVHVTPGPVHATPAPFVVSSTLSPVIVSSTPLPSYDEESIAVENPDFRNVASLQHSDHHIEEHRYNAHVAQEQVKYAAAPYVESHSNGAPLKEIAHHAAHNAAPAIVPSVKNSPEQSKSNQHKLIELLTARGGVAEVGLGREGHAAPVGDAGHVRARVLSATPAPEYAEAAGERVNTRRVVISRPIETLQEFDVIEPATKIERVSYQEPTIIKTAHTDRVQVHSTVPVYGKALAPAVAHAAVPVYQKTITPELQYYHH